MNFNYPRLIQVQYEVPFIPTSFFNDDFFDELFNFEEVQPTDTNDNLCMMPPQSSHNMPFVEQNNANPLNLMQQWNPFLYHQHHMLSPFRFTFGNFVPNQNLIPHSFSSDNLRHPSQRNTDNKNRFRPPIPQRQPRSNNNNNQQNELYDTPRSDLLVSKLTRDRICKDVPYPIVHLLLPEELFSNGTNGPPNISILVHHLKNEGRLADPTWRLLFLLVKQHFQQEPNLLTLSNGCTIVADIHGQFYDLLTIFELGRHPREQQYLFLGDYVDRGSFSCECIFLLFALKIRYPKTFYLLRGNHETKQMTKMFTFYNECKVKYSVDFWNECMAIFDCLPLCAIIDERFFCCHAGLSPHIRSINQINRLNRFQETPSDGPLCDLLWSDPHPQFSNPTTPPWSFNDQRKCSFYFNYSICSQFLFENRLLSVIRAHEVVPNGIVYFEKGQQTDFPVLMTLFSAPNYCDVYQNIASIIIYDQKRNFQPIQYRHRPHPFVLPNHESGFVFGNRFMLTYVNEILLTILQSRARQKSQTSSMDEQDDVTRRLDLKEKLLTDHTKKCRAINNMNLKLANLTPSENLTKKAIVNKDVFEEVLLKSTTNNIDTNENTQQNAFEQALKIDSLYEERIDLNEPAKA